MVLKKAYHSRRGNSVTRLVVILAVLLIVGFGGRIFYVRAQNKVAMSKGQMAQVKVAVSVTDSDQVAWSKLRDQDNSFEIKYPKNIFRRVSKQIMSPLPNGEKLKSVGLAHLIPSENCGRPDRLERCTPTTTDMAIDFFTVARNFNDVFKDLKSKYGQTMPVITIDGHQGVRFELYLDQEVLIYTVLPISNGKTLFIVRTSLTEKTTTKHPQLPNFIKVPEQKALFDQIMASLTFRPSL